MVHDSVHTLDTLDDRREVFVLLSHLPPADRFRFVTIATGWASGIGGRVPPSLYTDQRDKEAVRAARAGDQNADERITRMCWGFLMTLGNCWNLDLARVVVVLESLGRGQTRIGDLN